MELGFADTDGRYVFAEDTDVYISPAAKAIITQAQQNFGIFPQREIKKHAAEANRNFREAVRNVETVCTEEKSGRKVVIYIKGGMPDTTSFLKEHYRQYEDIPAYLWRVYQHAFFRFSSRTSLVSCS